MKGKCFVCGGLGTIYVEDEGIIEKCPGCSGEKETDVPFRMFFIVILVKFLGFFVKIRKFFGEKL